MDIVATVLSDDRVMINNEVYKRLKTIDGKYPQEKRKMYMKTYSKERILRSHLMADINQKEVSVTNK